MRSKKGLVLELPLESRWFNMIRRGEKREEYREIKPYWSKRLKDDEGYYRRFYAIRFRYGYTKKYIYYRLRGISVGRGRKEWGAPEKKVYILHLGRRLRANSIKIIKEYRII